jgi:CubicO group peptidase (beta-lactamase class C family)
LTSPDGRHPLRADREPGSADSRPRPAGHPGDLARYADQLFSRAYPAGGPGAAILIAKDGIASLTKQFIAAAILLLQERGKLAVSDDITSTPTT